MGDMGGVAPSRPASNGNKHGHCKCNVDSGVINKIELEATAGGAPAAAVLLIGVPRGAGP